MKRVVIYMALALLLSPAAGAQGGQTQKINKKNLVIKDWRTDAGSRHSTLDNQTTYSPEGRKIEEVEYDSTGKVKWRKRFEYGADGKVARDLIYDSNGRLTQIRKYEYNEFGRKKTRSNYDAKGRLLSVKAYEYLTEDE